MSSCRATRSTVKGTGRADYHRAIVSRRPLSPDGPFGVFADRLLAVELPDLPESRRSETVEFVGRSTEEIPSPLRLGVTVLAHALGVAQRLVGVDRTTRALQHSPLPLIGELPRMVRSLGFAYIWESWPDTSPTGGPDGVAAP